VTFNRDGTKIALYYDNGLLSLLDSNTGVALDNATLLSPLGDVGMAFDDDTKHLIIAGAKTYFCSIYPSFVKLVTASKRVTASCIPLAERKSFYLPDEPPEWCLTLRKRPYDNNAWRQWFLDKKAGKHPALPAL
jgi:hypothetical protein